MIESPILTSEASNMVRHVDALPPGTRLAEFEILGLLGVGGFGMVYKAFDHSLHRTVAIKEYMPSALVTRGDGGALWARSSSDEPAFQAGLHSFVDEARMLAQFDHPSLVKVFRFWEMQNTAYMVMPMYHGMTFKQARTQMRTPPSEAWLRQVLWSVLGALRVLHDANTLHRDVSPDNIFLQYAGPPVLLDLGASRHAINDQDRKHTAVLKVNYAPIEQYSDGTAEGSADLAQGPWSDLYSLGAVVHGCLCNDTPLPATLRSLRDRMVPFSRVAKTVRKQFGQEYSAPFVEAIGQVLKLQPEERPQSIDAFLAAMQMTVPPADMAHFDFRNALGDTWVEPTDQPDLLVGVTTVDLTGQPTVDAVNATIAVPSAETVATTDLTLQTSVTRGSEPASALGPTPDEPPTPNPRDEMDTVFLGADSAQPDEAQSTELPQHGSAEGSKGFDSQTAVKKNVRKKPWFAVAAVVFLMTAGAAFMGLRAPSNPASEPVVIAPSPADSIITELKMPPEEPLALQPEPDALSSSDATTTVADEVPESQLPPAFVASDDPRAAPAVVRGRARKTAAAPAPVPTTETLPVFEAPAPRPAPPPAPAPRRRELATLCADTNFLTRSSCLRQECASPINRTRAACIAFREAMDPLENNRSAN